MGVGIGVLVGDGVIIVTHAPSMNLALGFTQAGLVGVGVIVGVRVNVGVGEGPGVFLVVGIDLGIRVAVAVGVEDNSARNSAAVPGYGEPKNNFGSNDESPAFALGYLVAVAVASVIDVGEDEGVGARENTTLLLSASSRCLSNKSPHR